nr:unnamed protein product [Callosobruchus chinensis]
MNIIIVPLTRLFNMCILSSTFSKILRISKVIPIFKNSSIGKASNDRPIFSIPNFAKIMEILLIDQLTTHLESEGLLSSSQFDFRSNSSTTVANNNLIEVVNEAFENHLYVKVDLYDLSKHLTVFSVVFNWKNSSLPDCVLQYKTFRILSVE